jgi:hypothetical protein
MNSPAIPAAQQSLAIDTRLVEATLASCGWTPMELDVDFTAGRVVLELKRHDGRLLRLQSAGSHLFLERFQSAVSSGRQSNAKRGARLPTCNTVNMQFVGRTRFESPRMALRFFCDYVAGNPAQGFRALPAATVRALFAPAMRAEWPALRSAEGSES